MTLFDVFWVGAGGGAGSVLRWWIGKLTGERYHGSFPLGTFVINISGAFVIGFLTILFGVDWHDRYGTVLNAGMLTGVLGGYTTFSTMQLDAVKLTSGGEGRQAMFYLGLSVVAGLISAWLGAFLARSFF